MWYFIIFILVVALLPPTVEPLHRLMLRNKVLQQFLPSVVLTEFSVTVFPLLSEDRHETCRLSFMYLLGSGNRK